MTLESLPPEAPLPWSLRHEIGLAGGTPADGPEYHFYVTSAGGDVARIYPIDQAGEVVGERIVEAVNAYAEAARLTRERDAALEALTAADKALGINITTWITVAPALATPYPDAPHLTPWTRFGKRAADAAAGAQKAARQTITSIETGAIHNDQS